MSLTLADAIERHILALLEESGEAALQRVDLARHYDCAPSQINYVLSTRFSPERGFVTVSRRGGGGYIRIVRSVEPELPQMAAMLRRSQSGIAEAGAVAIIARCNASGWLGEREAQILMSMVRRDVLDLPLPERDLLRARLLAAALLAVSQGR
ncbi:MAG: CtsR family transcriptional regulator [Thermaerobacter sp.]|nr:CtsR family transcriptional regulator [Thermaerobacter sp.]